MKLLSENMSKNIQILRGGCILAVVLIHTLPMGLPQVFIRPFLNFAVGLFLFLSGLLSDIEKWNPLKRIKKVIIPYVIWTFIYTVLNNVNNLSGIPVAFLENIVTSKAKEHLYYIFVYCEFTVLIPLIDKLSKTKYKYWGLAIAPLEMILMRTIPSFTGLYNIKGTALCFKWFIYFYLGYLMGNGFLTVKKRPKLWFVLLLGGIFVQIAEGYWQYLQGVQNCGTQVKLSVILTNVPIMMFAYWFITGEKEYKLRIFKILGDNSFAVYFSHCAVIWLFSRLGIIFPLNGIIVIAADMVFIYIGKKVLGKYGKYLAL